MFYRIAKIIVLPFIYLLFWPRVEGLENFPEDGRVIVYSNHTSNFDPVVLGVLMPRQINFMAKEELFKIPLVGYIIRKLGAFPIKRGKADMSAIRHSFAILRQEQVLGMFPEGTRSKSGELQSFADGIASIALRTKSPVLPVAICDGYKCFRRITVRVGEPVEFKDYYDKRISNEELHNLSDELETILRQLMY